ncbi:Nn.00g025100.m01.CDS01 [Neocucurbitaria sp. VM-36]
MSHTIIPSHNPFALRLPISSTLSSGSATPINNSFHPSPPQLPHMTTPHSSSSTTTTMTNCYTPRESLEIVSRTGVKKAHNRLDKTFLSAISAGMILSFACATLISTNTAPWYQENAPGLIRTLAALVFPYGLVAVQMTGSDLCTGSFMYTGVAALHGRIGVLRMVRHWVVTFWGNLAGSLFVCLVVVGYGGIFDGTMYRDESLVFAYKKQIVPAWYQIFLRGIGANWLVCMACYLGCSGRDYFSKVVGIWWPTFAFVSLGFDHVVANMFLIPNAIFHGSPSITVGLYIWKGIIPALLGNIIGGGFFVGCLYYYLHLHGQSDVAIDGCYYEASGLPQDEMKPTFWRKRDDDVGRLNGDEKV